MRICFRLEPLDDVSFQVDFRCNMREIRIKCVASYIQHCFWENMAPEFRGMVWALETKAVYRIDYTNRLYAYSHVIVWLEIWCNRKSQAANAAR
jgi:hypothetical protein